MGQAEGGGQVRDDAEGRQAGARRDGAKAVREQADVPAEPVDQVAPQQPAFLIRQQFPRAHQVGDDAAPVDVRHQHHRHPGGGGEAHVGDIVGPQVDLGGAAGAFHQDEVRIRLQPLEALQHRRHQFLFHVLEVAGVEVAANLAVDHDLRADVRLRLEQNRVHVHRRRHPAGPGLKRLRAADLAAVQSHRRVVGHVLRLERPYGMAPAREHAAKAGGHQRLAGVRGGSLEHERTGGHGSGSAPLRVMGMPAATK